MTDLLRENIMREIILTGHRTAQRFQMMPVENYARRQRQREDLQRQMNVRRCQQKKAEQTAWSTRQAESIMTRLLQLLSSDVSIV
jgi:hypothetical protein